MFSARLSYAVTDPAAIALLQGLTEATERKGYELHLLPGMRGTGLEVEAVREAVVGGFCLYCMPDDHPALRPRSSGGCRSSSSTSRASPARSSSASRTGRARARPRGTSRGLGHEHVAVIVDRLRDDGTGPDHRRERIAAGYYRVSRERIAG